MVRRPIEFRGRTLKGQWLYGDLIQGINDAEVYINVGIPERGRGIYAEDICMVNPKSVGQYSGINDKNGVKIYEGDIIQFFGYTLKTAEKPTEESHREIVRYIGKVEFKDGAFVLEDDSLVFGLGFEDLNEVYTWVDRRPGTNKDYNGVELDERIVGIEVIGNIYDNPRLYEIK